LKTTLNQTQLPEIVINTGDKKAMAALKKFLSGYCGVYRWIDKSSYKTLVEQKIRVIALCAMQVLAVLIHNLKDLSFVMAMIVFT
jgi:hypothetical protein